jgi:hypothetical protein
MARKEKPIRTYKEFSEMGFEELLRELKEMLGKAQRINVWFSAIERVELLPGLQALHDKCAQPGRRTDLGKGDPNKPRWDEVCKLLGISPDLIRMWRMRTAANNDIRHLLGEQPAKPRLSQEQRNREAQRHLMLLCGAVLNGDEEAAEKMALMLAELYGF